MTSDCEDISLYLNALFNEEEVTYHGQDEFNETNIDLKHVEELILKKQRINKVFEVSAKTCPIPPNRKYCT